MAEQQRVVIADDDETFFHSTAEVLSRQGYDCSHASNVEAARDLLAQGDVAVLIADVAMPGNKELELVRDLPAIAEGTPAILVSGGPSPRSIIASARLPLAGYLVKPVDPAELLECTRNAFECFHAYQAMGACHGRLEQQRKRLAELRDLVPLCPSHVPARGFLDLTLLNIVDGLIDMSDLMVAVAAQEGSHDVCRLRDCPRVAALSGAVRQAISVLEKTKSSFRSKELGELRKSLEHAVSLREE